MKTGRGSAQVARQEALYGRYVELRDAGERPVDATRETGISDGTGQRYERSYRLLRNIRPKRTDAFQRL